MSEPTTLEVVVEVWSPPLDPNLMWYAERGIPEYWLAEPIEGEKWDALVTMYDIARSASGRTTFVETRRTTLSQLERAASPGAAADGVS